MRRSRCMLFDMMFVDHENGVNLELNQRRLAAARQSKPPNFSLSSSCPQFGQCIGFVMDPICICHGRDMMAP